MTDTNDQESRDEATDTVFLDEKNGDDKNEGTEQSPVKTLQRAANLARRGISPMLTADIMIAEHSGEDHIDWKVRARAGEGL